MTRTTIFAALLMSAWILGGLVESADAQTGARVGAGGRVGVRAGGNYGGATGTGVPPGGVGSRFGTTYGSAISQGNMPPSYADRISQQGLPRTYADAVIENGLPPTYGDYVTGNVPLERRFNSNGVTEYYGSYDGYRGQGIDRPYDTRYARGNWQFYADRDREIAYVRQLTPAERRQYYANRVLVQAGSEAQYQDYGAWRDRRSDRSATFVTQPDPNYVLGPGFDQTDMHDRARLNYLRNRERVLREMQDFERAVEGTERRIGAQR